MSSYTNDDSYARGFKGPNGRGPVRTHHYSEMSNSASRSLNYLESSKEASRIDDALARDIARATERAAKRYFDLMRRQLTPHRLGNHTVCIDAGSGSAYLYVVNRITGKHTMVSDLRRARASLVVSILQEIDQFLSWEWAQYLDKKNLT